MPGPYGITTTGFNAKTLPEQIAEIETEEVAIWGAGIQLGAETPLGQLNGLFADSAAEFWETAGALYWSFDIDNATGVRLDSVGKLQRMTRPVGISDLEFRKQISGSGYGDLKTRRLRSLLLALPGVTSVQITINSKAVSLPNGLEPKSIAVSVVGGVDADIAAVILENTVEGIDLQGNTAVEIDDDGRCITVAFIRPTVVDFNIEVDFSSHPDRCSCTPDDAASLASKLLAELTGDCGIQAGAIITPATIEQALNGANGVVVEEVRIARDGETPVFQNVVFRIDEQPNITAALIKTALVTYSGPTTTQGGLDGFGIGQGTIV